MNETLGVVPEDLTLGHHCESIQGLHPNLSQAAGNISAVLARLGFIVQPNDSNRMTVMGAPGSQGILDEMSFPIRFSQGGVEHEGRIRVSIPVEEPPVFQITHQDLTVFHVSETRYQENEVFFHLELGNRTERMGDGGKQFRCIGSHDVQCSGSIAEVLNLFEQQLSKIAGQGPADDEGSGVDQSKKRTLTGFLDRITVEPT